VTNNVLLLFFFKKIVKTQQQQQNKKSNPGPIAPKADALPLHHRVNCEYQL